MGYLVAVTIIEQLGSVDELRKLHKSLVWRAFALPKSDLTLVEWIHRPNPNNPPPHNIKFPEHPEFARRPSGISFPDKFGDELPELDSLYDSLVTAKRASCFPKVAIHLAKKISELTGCRVANIFTDDGWDFECEANSGKLVCLEFDSGEIDEGEFEFFRMNPEGGFDSYRQKVLHKLMHEVGLKAALKWDGRLEGMFGFDGDPAMLQLVEVGRTSDIYIQPTRATRSSSNQKPFWKLW